MLARLPILSASARGHPARTADESERAARMSSKVGDQTPKDQNNQQRTLSGIHGIRNVLVVFYPLPSAGAGGVGGLGVHPQGMV